MANVFTRRHHYPKSTTLHDFCGQKKLDFFIPREMSPTRQANPHPAGLVHQDIPSKQVFAIWNPNFDKIASKLPKMIEHLDKVNFSCNPVVILSRESGKIPEVKYTETTTSRISYKHPSRFPDIFQRKFADRYEYAPTRKASIGIVPNVIVKPYKPVEYKIP